MQTFAINITDNSEVECNETFSIAILSVTTCGVIIGSNRVSEVIIRDDNKYLNSYVYSPRNSRHQILQEFHI